MIAFESHVHFRTRLLLSILTHRPITITAIRPNSSTPGLSDFESSYLRLLDKLTTGTILTISHTGTSITFSPGFISGGTIHHQCPLSRSIGYFLEPLLILAPFAKQVCTITLEGVTNNNIDISVDLIRTSLMPQLARYGIPDGVLTVKARGALPDGGGTVVFTTPLIRTLKPSSFIDEGLIKRIRGICYSTRTSPQIANRLVDASRGELAGLTSDVYLFTDVRKGTESGKSPGFGVSLVAESTTGVVYGVESFFNPTLFVSPLGAKRSMNESYNGENEEKETIEDLGVRVAKELMAEILKGGTVDSMSQWIHLLLIALGPEDVGKVKLSQLTDFTITFLRDLDRMMGVRFKIKEDESGVIMTGMGTGFASLKKVA